MEKKITSLANKLFNKLNIQIIKRSFFEKLMANQIADLELLKTPSRRYSIQAFV